MLKGLSPLGAPPQIILEQHHQCADRYILDVRLDVDIGSVWARPNQSMEEQKEHSIAKVSMPVFTQGTSIAFLVSFIKFS